MSPEDDRLILTLAVGRVLRLLSGPYQPGDDDRYMEARSAALNAADRLGLDTTDLRTRRPAMGAAGD